MGKKPDPSGLREWKALAGHLGKMNVLHLRDLFRSDPGRGKKFSLSLAGLYLDYSKNRITGETMDLLFGLAEKTGLKEKTEAMFTGEKINTTEDRAVLHTALRNFSGRPVLMDGVDVMPDIAAMRERMKNISHRIRGGQWAGFSGKPVKNIVNIGIGGSDLGPRLACGALRWYSDRDLEVRFVSNVDGTDLTESLRDLSPEETLFIVASKTFTTVETMTNAGSAKEWVRSAAGGSDFTSRHFIAVTSNLKNAAAFGIPEENTLPMSDWVGGRYSLTSSIGLAVMIAVGFDHFMKMLKGFYRMDDHFRNAPLKENIPVVLALLGIWYNNFFGFGSHAVLPYDEYLSLLPAYLQQCDMESNGKGVDLQGNGVRYATGPVIWGGQGTNCQHAFFQLLHQGTSVIPADFIGFAEPLNEPGDHHTTFAANLLAQTRALAFGRERDDPALEGLAEKDIPFRVFPGNRPSNTLLFRKLTPETLGMLIALYEHKIFTQGAVWNINSFDQWGVELGKKIASGIALKLEGETGQSGGADSSTRELIKVFHSFRDGDEGH